ncbi:hypothetical protein MBLNU230_g2229t1 [Neophaeotheca triangularis]
MQTSFEQKHTIDLGHCILDPKRKHSITDPIITGEPKAKRQRVYYGMSDTDHNPNELYFEATPDIPSQRIPNELESPTKTEPDTDIYGSGYNVDEPYFKAEPDIPSQRIPNELESPAETEPHAEPQQLEPPPQQPEIDARGRPILSVQTSFGDTPPPPLEVVYPPEPQDEPRWRGWYSPLSPPSPTGPLSPELPPTPPPRSPPTSPQYNPLSPPPLQPSPPPPYWNQEPETATASLPPSPGGDPWWPASPGHDPRDDEIAELKRKVALQKAVIGALRDEVALQHRRVIVLEARRRFEPE